MRMIWVKETVDNGRDMLYVDIHDNFFLSYFTDLRTAVYLNEFGEAV